MKVILLLIINVCYGYFNSNLFNFINKSLKDKARAWFIDRSEKKGIKWEEITDFYKSEESSKDIDLIFIKKNNLNIRYPEYYKKPFHGYDEGNLNWLAGYENEASTISMSSSCFKNTTPEESSLILRKKFVNSIIKYNFNKKNVTNILDIGCSIGISTEYIKKLIPFEVNIVGLDLSPYFISIAEFNSQRKNLDINYIHANAENTNLDYNSYDLICSSFMFHELPPYARNNILKEINNLLIKGGTVAILDYDPIKIKNILNKDNWRRIVFESTEPHIYTYYDCDMVKELENNKFIDIQKKYSDRFNSIWIASK